MRRVVVTGMGIVSSIGNNPQEVLASLREARSGISRAEKYAELGFRSQVQGAPTLKAEEVVDRRAMRFHGGGTAWNHVAMDQAILDSGLAGLNRPTRMSLTSVMRLPSASSHPSAMPRMSLPLKTRFTSTP